MQLSATQVPPLRKVRNLRFCALNCAMPSTGCLKQMIYGGRVFASFNYSDGQVVRASASGALDLGLILSRVKPMTI